MCNICDGNESRVTNSGKVIEDTCISHTAATSFVNRKLTYPPNEGCANQDVAGYSGSARKLGNTIQSENDSFTRP